MNKILKIIMATIVLCIYFSNAAFAKFEKMTVNIEWLTNLDEIGVTELESSYKNFKLTK